jgi:curved DNA-binding protein CbpA
MTIEAQTHYQVLELEAGASQDDVRQAYRDLAKVWHPDRFSDNPKLQQKAEEKLKKINAAYGFLKSYQPQAIKSKTESKQAQSAQKPLNYEKLGNLLASGKFKDADHETKRLLLELAGREREGWLLPDNAKSLSFQELSAIDQLWLQHSNSRFGFSTQRKIWNSLGCKSSNNIPAQTISENTFGQFVQWRIGSRWVSPYDSFNYDLQAPKGSLPRAYIFALNGWWSYTNEWTGYLLLKFDEIIMRF